MLSVFLLLSVFLFDVIGLVFNVHIVEIILSSF